MVFFIVSVATTSALSAAVKRAVELSFEQHARGELLDRVHVAVAQHFQHADAALAVPMGVQSHRSLLQARAPRAPARENDDVPITLTHLNACPADEFVAAVGPIFEHSPWIAAPSSPSGRSRRARRCTPRCAMSCGPPAKNGSSR